MSLLDTASLIVTPNGYKDGKLYSVIPSDGSGDLSVTRATTATRVNSAGLVELVPYNLFSYSEQFDNADWGKNVVTITPNATTAPDGTLTADKIILDSGSQENPVVFQVLDSNTSTRTLSFYAKASEYNIAFARVGGASSAPIVLFSLTGSGSILHNQNALSYSIEALANGWYRCSMTYAHGAAFAPNIGVCSSTYSVSSLSVTSTGNGTSGIFIWGAQLVEGSTAKDYQKTETRLNIPRLDYSNGTCPSLLVEPQRTNLALYSSSFDNAAWTKFGSTSATANTAISPSGIQDADTITTSGLEVIRQSVSLTANSVNTYSVYVKKISYDYFGFQTLISGSGSKSVFNLSNGTIQSQGSGHTASIEDAGNGWYRCIVTFNCGSSSSNIFDFTTDTSISTLQSFYAWGAQAEAGNYSTSYIPTTSASVTRNADVISKTGISSLIGQTEGVVFLDYYASAQNQDALTYAFLFLGGNSTNNIQLFNIGTALYWYVRNTAGVIIDQTANQTLVAGTRYKIALAYKSGEYALYINGVQKRTSTNSSAPPAMSQFNLNAEDVGASAAKVKNEFNAVAFWPTRLTNDQLTALTTI